MATKKKPARKRKATKTPQTGDKRAPVRPRAQLPDQKRHGKDGPPIVANDKASAKVLESLGELRTQGIPFLAVSKLKTWAGNPNKHEPGVPRLLRIIQRYGWTIPLVVRTEADDAGLHEISAGHGRLLAAAGELGLVEVPVIYRNFSVHDSHAYGLADNRAPEFSDIDGPSLQAVLDELLANDGQQDVFDAGWTPEDLETLAGAFDVPPADDYPDMGPMDGPKYKTITLLMTAEQHGIVTAALERAGALSGRDAKAVFLVKLCEAYLDGR